MKIPLLVATLLSAGTAYATNPLPPGRLGIEAYHETYRETLNGARFMQEKGQMLGVNLGIRFDLSDEDAIQFEGRYARGNADYDSASGFYGGLKRVQYDLSLAWKHDTLLKYTLLTTELGLGQRRLNDHLDESGPGGYRRESTYNYLLAAVGTRNRIDDAWSLAPRLAYKHLLSGKQASRLSDVYPACSTLKNHQNKGYGLELTLAFDKQLPEANVLSIAPFYRYWSIKDSSTDISYCYGQPLIAGMEPANTTHEAGIGVSYAF